MDWRDNADRIEPALAADPTEQKEANEATGPTDRTDPAEHGTTRLYRGACGRCN
jgi:hypothetical protein